MIKALILTGFGINCEEEMAAAYRQVGAEAEIIHINEVLKEKRSIHDFQILNFPGGFSFGDDLSSGKVLANKIKYKKLPSGKVLLDEIITFINDGKLVFGVCNGFQVLVKLGLLPNIHGDYQQEVTLAANQSGKYENRWVLCSAHKNNPSPFIQEIDQLALPVRHGEGQLIIESGDIRKAIVDQGLNCLTYCDEKGAPVTAYPANPNGAALSCAGLTDTTGRVMGMMPHPEAFLSLYNHPNWGQIKRNHPEHNEEGEGTVFFKNAVDFFKKEMA